MTRSRLRAGVAFLIAVGLVLYGALLRMHVVVTADGERLEVADPLVTQATSFSGVHMGEYGVLTGDPSSWGDTAGKECPT